MSLALNASYICSLFYSCQQDSLHPCSTGPRGNIPPWATSLMFFTHTLIRNVGVFFAVTFAVVQHVLETEVTGGHSAVRFFVICFVLKLTFSLIAGGSAKSTSVIKIELRCCRCFIQGPFQQWARHWCTLLVFSAHPSNFSPSVGGHHQQQTQTGPDGKLLCGCLLNCGTIFMKA